MHKVGFLNGHPLMKIISSLGSNFFRRSLLILLVSLYPLQVFSQVSFSQNHPELVWKEFETEHFKIIYHKGTETIAHRVAVIAEGVYGPITKDLGTEPPNKTPIIVSDYSDYSNGLSTPLGHYIYLWTKSETKLTTGDTQWLQTLVAHEFTHMVNFWAFRAFPGYWRELLALGFIPTWFLEGIAQYEAEKWCSNRDMLMRVATYSKRMLPYKKLTGFIGTDWLGSRLVYEQGHSLIRFIAAEYGSDKILKIIKNFRSFPLSFNLALKKSIGLSEKELFKKWQKKINNHYDEVRSNHTSVSETGQIIQTPFQGNLAARWSPDGEKIAILGMKEFDEQVPELYLTDSKFEQFQKVNRPFVHSFFSWSPDSRFIVFSQEHYTAAGSLFNDLFILNTQTGEIQQLTEGERATDPVWSPDGKKIVCSIYQGTKSNLAIYDVETGKRRIITNFPDWVEVFTPSWSSKNDIIAFSIIDQQHNRDIWTVSSDGSDVQPLIDHPEDDRFPHWSPDGKKLAFISYRNGAPNLFLLEVGTNEITQITDTPGGVFNPAWLPDGNHLAVTVFEQRDKADIAILPAEARQNNFQSIEKLDFHSKKMPVISNADFSSPAQKIQFEPRTYRSILNIRSQILLPILDMDENGWQPGVLNLAADPLGKHTLMTTFSYRTRPHFSLDYTNLQFSPNIDVSLYKTTIDHGNFLRISDDKVLPLYENDWWTSMTFSWPINFGKSRLSNHLLWLQGTARYRSTINYSDYERARIAPWALPFQGWINYATVGYSWYSYRPDVSYDIHPKNGTVFSLYLRHSDTWMYSDLPFSQLGIVTRIRKEWPFREHVIAMRAGASFRDGDQPIQSRLAIGSRAIRGLSDSAEGDQQLFSNLEYRFPLIRDLGLKLWILYFERFTGAIFLDSGKAWGSHLATLFDGRKRSFGSADWIHTTGLELRHRFYFFGKIPVVFQAGFAVDLNDPDAATTYFRMGPVF